MITLVASKLPQLIFMQPIDSGDSITMAPRALLEVARIAAVAVIVSAMAIKFFFIKISLD